MRADSVTTYTLTLTEEEKAKLVRVIDNLWHSHDRNHPELPFPQILLNVADALDYPADQPSEKAVAAARQYHDLANL